MTLAWVAGRLQMGVWAHVSNLLRAGAAPRARPRNGAMSVNSED
jgi:hypothetical protein